MLKVCFNFCTMVVVDADGDGGDAVLELGGGDAAATLLGGGEDFAEEGGGEAEVLVDWETAPLMVMPVPA